MSKSAPQGTEISAEFGVEIGAQISAEFGTTAPDSHQRLVYCKNHDNLLGCVVKNFSQASFAIKPMSVSCSVLRLSRSWIITLMACVRRLSVASDYLVKKALSEFGKT